MVSLRDVIGDTGSLSGRNVSEGSACEDGVHEVFYGFFIAIEASLSHYGCCFDYTLHGRRILNEIPTQASRVC